jgi:hypothetical protein
MEKNEIDYSGFNNKKRAFIEALEANLGIVTKAAAAVGMSREIHYHWLKNDAEYKFAVEQVDDMVLDFAESKLHSLINDGDTAATIFYMKTKGKKRGYIERQELTGADNQPIITISANL